MLVLLVLIQIVLLALSGVNDCANRLAPLVDTGIISQVREDSGILGVESNSSHTTLGGHVVVKTFLVL